MSCCKVKEYKWCAGEPAVYTDEQERGYCVFHAPAGKKGSASKEFEKKVFSRINSGSESGQPCVLSGTVFEDISFKKYGKNKPLPEISFHNATFSGKAYFIGATFSGKANFSGATFGGEAYFIGATFSGETDFSETTFNEKAFFSAATFNGEAYFFKAIFNKKAEFSKVIFMGQADFYAATFNEIVTFYIAKFGGETCFVRATFIGKASFSWSSFSGEADFSDATFSGKANFFQSTFDSKTDFRGKTFWKGGNLRDININEKIRFDRVDFTKVSFMDTDLRRMDFVNCIWPKSVHFEWPKKKDHDILYDEVKIYEGLKSKGWYGRFKAFLYPDDEKFGKVETLYRRLKQKYKEDHDEQRASHWHFCEKEMFRKRNLRRRFFGLTALYGVSSGYGELPFRAFLFLLLLIVALSFVQGLLGVVPFSGEPVYGIERINGFFDMMDCWAFVALVLNTIQYATFQKVTAFKPASLLGDFIKSLTQVALPVQAALFALAIRNRLRR